MQARVDPTTYIYLALGGWLALMRLIDQKRR